MPHRTGANPVPDDVQTELTRVVRRWQQLPLDHAESCLPRVAALLADLAQPTERARADAENPARPGVVVPDLGPAVVMDQLRVLVFDACAAGRTDGLVARLAALRQSMP